MQCDWSLAAIVVPEEPRLRVLRLPLAAFARDPNERGGQEQEQERPGAEPTTAQHSFRSTISIQTAVRCKSVNLYARSSQKDMSLMLHRTTDFTLQTIILVKHLSVSELSMCVCFCVQVKLTLTECDQLFAVMSSNEAFHFASAQLGNMRMHIAGFLIYTGSF